MTRIEEGFHRSGFRMVGAKGCLCLRTKTGT
jgi:hypothetical protein